MSEYGIAPNDTVMSPARNMFLIVPNDDDALPAVTKAIRADVGGTVALRTAGSTEDVAINMAAGEVLAVRAEYVRDTGTSATLHGLA